MANRYTKNNKIELVSEFLREDDNNSLPTITAAKRIFALKKGVFASLEAARTMVRAVRGLSGEKMIHKSMRDDLCKQPGWLKQLPVSDALPKVPYDIPFTGTGGILCDVHIPYHDRNALASALDYLESKGATDFLILNGDIIDCYQLSRFDKDPNNRRFKDERKMTVDFLEKLTKRFKNIAYKMGNHEDRHRRLLLSQAPELYDIPELTLESLLHLEELGIHPVSGLVPIRVHGHLSIWHGHEFPVAGTVNPARGTYQRLKSCSIIGHCHRTSHHSEIHHDAKRTTISCWSVGCTSELGPDYSPVNAYNHGFAILEIGKTSWQVAGNYRIVNGQVFGS